jgi:hypothetical protein
MRFAFDVGEVSHVRALFLQGSIVNRIVGKAKRKYSHDTGRDAYLPSPFRDSRIRARAVLAILTRVLAVFAIATELPRR